MIDIGNITALSTLNFSVFLVANDTISFQQASITGVSFGIIAINNMSVSESVLNTTGQSCKTNAGLGRGAIIQYNNSFCTSGSSSCGFGVISNVSLCGDIIQYFLFLSHSFPYISKGPYLSTGSGGYGYNPAISNQRGAGGGIIFLLSRKYLLLESSQVLASGGNVEINDTLSAGSGGTIFITAKDMVGLGPNNISATGGNSGNNKGGGGGGLVKISFVNVSANVPYSLWVDMNQGYQ